MTATDTTVASAEPPRDRYGRYLIPDPETGKPTPYTRATTFAKSVSDTFGLTKWMLRMGGLGLAQRQDLMLAIAAADPADAKTLDRIMAEAKEHAGASSGATIGTALHSFTEAVDRGESPVVPPPWDADVAAYVKAVADAGLEIIDEHIEQIVVIPSLQVAGTLDRVVRTSDGRLVIADLKTGKDVSFAMGEIAVQLALYAAAPYTFDPATGELDVMPVVDQTEALVFHAPAGQGRCDVLSVDISAGREMFSIIETVRSWRKRRDLHRPYSPGVATNPSVAAPGEPLDDVAGRLAWVTDACTELVNAGAADELVARWPVGIPTLKQARESGQAHNVTELDAIHRALLDAAAAAGHPFFAAAYPDDDAMVPANDERIITLRDRIDVLPNDLLERLQLRLSEHGTPRLSGGRARRSDVDQVTGWVDELTAEHTARRSVAAAHLGELDADVQPAAMRLAGVTGPATLTHQGAERIGIVVDALQLGYLTFTGGDIVAADDAFARVLDAHGGAKRAVIDTARQAASLYGLARPSSSTQVASDVMLLAATAMATPSN
jgi:hypothetical protein